MMTALINPSALLALLRRPLAAGPRRVGRLRAWWREEIAFRRTLAEMRQIDGREAADLDLNAADFPFRARQHVRRSTQISTTD